MSRLVAILLAGLIVAITSILFTLDTVPALLPASTAPAGSAAAPPRNGHVPAPAGWTARPDVVIIHSDAVG